MAEASENKSVREVTNLTPINVNTEEIEFEHARARHLEARARHVFTLAKYFGGVAIIFVVTIACLYSLLWNPDSPITQDIVKLLFVIVGGVVGAIYTSNNNHKGE